jgi:cell division protein FtsB
MVGIVCRGRFMVTRQRRRSVLNRLWMPLITAAFLGYFGYHAFHGFYGILSRERLEAEALALSAQLESLEQERAGYERKVEMLRADQLDADLIDFEARRALNRIRADEVVLRLNNAQQ